MRRRTFLQLMSTTTVWPLASRANQPREPYRLAFVHSGLPAHELTETQGPFWVRQFFTSLRRLGHSEGSDLLVERYSAEGHDNRFGALTHAVVARQPDIIVTNSNALVAVFKQATATIPIVSVVADPVRSGLVASLARPGGNVTGVSIDAGIEIYGKRLQLLKTLVPSAGRMGHLARQTEWDSVFGRQLREAGRQIGVEVTGMLPRQVTAEELRRTLGEAPSTPVSAALVSASGDFLAHRGLIIALAAGARLPVLYPYRDYVELGGLVAYGPDQADTASRLADQVHRILAGAAPAEMPFHQATRFELVIHLQAARSLGIEVPTSILAQADEVIE